MRVLASLLLFSGCWLTQSAPDAGQAERSARLEILSPRPGETRNVVSYRLHIVGYSPERVVAATPQQPERVIASRTGCEGPPQQCVGDLLFEVMDSDVEVWAEYIDLDGTPGRTPRQTVHVNSLPVVLAPLSQTATRATFLVTGANALDPSTFGTLVVRKSFAITDTQARVEMVSGFTLTAQGNRLHVDGEFLGPAAYELDLSHVTNVFGTALPSQSLGVAYFSPVAGSPEGDSFGSTRPRIERAIDGSLRYVAQRGVWRLEPGGGLTPLVTWTDQHRGFVDRAGTAYRIDAPAGSTAQPERWDGAAWVALPPLSLPSLPPRAVHVFSMAFDAAGTAFLLNAVCGQGSPACTEARVQRFDAGASAWVTVFTESFTRLTTWLELFPFEDSVALFFKQRGPNGEFASAPTMLAYSSGGFVDLPSPVSPPTFLIVADQPILPNAVRVEQGRTLVNAGLAGFVGQERFAFFEWNGSAWTTRDDGVKALLAHTALGPTPEVALDLSALWVDAFDVLPSGDLAVITWEQSGQGLELRFHVGGYLLSGSTWSPLPRVSSPFLAGGERYQSVAFRGPTDVWAVTTVSGPTAPYLVKR